MVLICINNDFFFVFQASSELMSRYVIPPSSHAPHHPHMGSTPPHHHHQMQQSHDHHMKMAAEMQYNASNPFSINRLLPGNGGSGGALAAAAAADPQQAKQHLDLHSSATSAGYDYNAFASHTSESMYYPPALYPVHHSVANSVHSNI